MTLRGLANGAAVVVVLLSAMLAVARVDGPAMESGAAVAGCGPGLQLVPLPDGRQGLRDHSRHVTPLRRYERILSGSTVADQLLQRLCERDRIVAFTAYGAEYGARADYAGKATHPGLHNLELLHGLRPDLIVTNHIGDPRVLSRLRDQGFEVFDLGDMRGVDALVPNIHQVALLVGDAPAGHALADQLVRRLTRLAADVPQAKRRRGMYVSLYGTQLSGGTRGSSYGDVLRHAGVVDVAASRYSGFPRYTAEDLLDLDPELVVVGEGMAARLCEYPGLDSLSACRRDGGIVEIPGRLMGDPGPRLLEAAELLHDGVYPYEK